MKLISLIIHRIAQKKSVLGTFALSIILMQPSCLSAQDYTQTIDRTLQFSDAGNPTNQMKVYNVFGDVTVEGYNGDEVQVTAYQKIEGSEREIEKALEELTLVTEQDGNNIYVYLDAPFITVKKEGDRIHYRVDRHGDDGYDFLYDITIRVPRHSGIHASTINRGTVRVKNTINGVYAGNVNGKVELSGIAGSTKAHTVNGDISIRYADAPTEDSSYKTINGTIEVNYPQSLSADIRFKSMHGELYTDFQNITKLKSQVKTEKKRSNGAAYYKVDRFSPIRIGDGGPIFSFEVLNGDVYIKQIKS